MQRRAKTVTDRMPPQAVLANPEKREALFRKIQKALDELLAPTVHTIEPASIDIGMSVRKTTQRDRHEFFVSM